MHSIGGGLYTLCRCLCVSAYALQYAGNVGSTTVFDAIEAKAFKNMNPTVEISCKSLGCGVKHTILSNILIK